MGDPCPDAAGKDCPDTEEPRTMFDPPLSKQRYMRVAEILRSENVKRVRAASRILSPDLGVSNTIPLSNIITAYYMSYWTVKKLSQHNFAKFYNKTLKTQPAILCYLLVHA